MSRMQPVGILGWEMLMDVHGYTCLELRPARLAWSSSHPSQFDRRRYGWIVNAPATGWAAHLGPWDSSDTTIPQLMEHFEDLGDAQTWVMSELAAWWRQEAKSRRE